MQKANDSYGAKSRKRPRESVSDGEVGSNSPREERASVRSVAKRQAPELRHAKSIVTARMPIKLLTTTWSLGSNRSLDRRHVQKLKKAFVELGGPKRDLEEHHLKVLCTGAEVERMMKELGLQDGAKKAEDMPDFTTWPDVNGQNPLELLAGQHRICALEEWVKDAKLSEEELWWPYSMSLEQNLKLRVNSKDVAKPDSHGDIWLHIVTVVSQKPDKFQGKGTDIAREMAETLELRNEIGVPMTRLVSLWRNKKWRKMVTAWCQTAVGRATFKIRPWYMMMACRIDDFWFSIFGQVLSTLASFPGDAASYVKAEDWKKMSKVFESKVFEPIPCQKAIKELFYPGSQQVDQSCRRRVDFLFELDREAYWQVYEHVLPRGQTSFPDVHRILSLSEQDGKVLSGVMDHVADWLSSVRSKRPHKRENNKPGLRVDIVPALQHFNEKRLQEAKRRVTTFVAEALDQTDQSIAETTSIVMQQELLEFVCGRLEAFKSASAKEQLNQPLDTDNAGLYRTRFQQAEWADILNIVRWYMGPEFRPEWPRPEESRPGDVSHLVDVTIQNLKDIINLTGDKTHYNKLSSASFRDKLTNLLGELCGAGEESSPSGSTTGEANEDAESTTCTSAVPTRRDAGGEDHGFDLGSEHGLSMTQREPRSSYSVDVPPSGQIPKTVLEDRAVGTDAGGEDDGFDLGSEYGLSMTQRELPSSPSAAGTDADGEDDGFGPGSENDFVMAKAKKKTALSTPSTAKEKTKKKKTTAKEKTALSVPTQQAAPAKRRPARPLSPQSPSGENQKMSTKRAGDTNLTAAQKPITSSNPIKQPEWMKGVKAVQK
ncbi:hypothetical protein E4U32_006882 [Claviceps aff. humidiphila group G2b]|nr:hypothetical protein E4U32_006882 [Claviceps aff. humidiphila group G2b]